MKNLKAIYLLAFLIVLFASCSKTPQSETTGWYYNDPEWGGFEVTSPDELRVGPGLVFIEGGTFVMGRTQDDIAYEWDNVEHRVTVSSFFLDETEVRNVDYREFIYWLTRIYGEEFPEEVRKMYPDTAVWRNKLAYNEKMVEHYFQNNAYNDYPVVGVSWEQATEYCKWRTDRVNEKTMVDHGILNMDAAEVRPDNYFQTDTYIYGLYNGDVLNELTNLDPRVEGEPRKVRWDDGILYTKYRLPTEAEWEFAAWGLIGNTIGERQIERRIYPWNGNVVRSNQKKTYGELLTNFKRGRGDNMGIAGDLNDEFDYTSPVRWYYPNDYGLYNMAGNVSEWCMDVYRKLSPQDVADHNPFRGNVYKTTTIENEEIVMDEKTGKIVYKNEEDNFNRRNYKQADNINYLDGDYASSIPDGSSWLPSGEESPELMEKLNNPDSVTTLVYNRSTSLISNKTRVIKGGSWKDRAYWLSPGNRRYLDQRQATDWIGFRCAMDKLGGSTMGR